MDFAVIDDSQMRHGKIFVYSHALLIFESLPKILVFSGDRSIYRLNEDKVIAYIEENLPEQVPLYACNHYKRYCALWERLVFASIDDVRERAIIQTFNQADLYARAACREALEKRIKIGSQYSDISGFA